MGEEVSGLALILLLVSGIGGGGSVSDVADIDAIDTERISGCAERERLALPHVGRLHPGGFHVVGVVHGVLVSTRGSHETLHGSRAGFHVLEVERHGTVSGRGVDNLHDEPGC